MQKFTVPNLCLRPRSSDGVSALQWFASQAELIAPGQQVAEGAVVAAGRPASAGAIPEWS